MIIVDLLRFSFQKKNVLSAFLCWTGLIFFLRKRTLQSNNLIILAYHRVIPEYKVDYEFDDDLISATPEQFDWQVRYIKENYTVNKADKFPNLLEYIMTIAELPQKGSVHLNICNNILDNIVNLEDIHLDTKLDENTRDTTQHIWYDKSVPVPKNISSTELLKDYKKEIPDSEDHSLLQYYEKHYEQIEENEKNEQRNK